MERALIGDGAKGSLQDFKVTKYELEPLEDDRVTVNVECCGVCGSVSVQHQLPRGCFSAE